MLEIVILRIRVLVTYIGLFVFKWLSVLEFFCGVGSSRFEIKFSVPYVMKHKNLLSFKRFEYQEHLNEMYKSDVLILIKMFACIIISPTKLVCVNSLSVIVRIRFKDMLLVAYLSICLRSLNILKLVDRRLVSQKNFRAAGVFRIFSTWCSARINYLPFI